MGFTATARCPDCRTGYLVSCRTQGDPSSPSDYPHRFSCANCGKQVLAHLPANVDRETIDVQQD